MAIFLRRSIAASLVLFLTVSLGPSCSYVGQQKAVPSIPPLQRAEAAWRQLAAGHNDASIIASYDEAVKEVVGEMAHHQSPAKWTSSVRLGGGEVVKVDAGSTMTHQTWSPALFDELHTRHRDVSPTTAAKAIRPGVGATFDGIHEHDESKPDARFVFHKGQHLPVTALIEFGAHHIVPVLRLYDPREVQAVAVGGHKVALAADLALPGQEVLNKRSFLNQALAGLFRPERFMADQGLYMLEPYRADKIPVVFVHGLMSDPHIWENEVISLMADAELSKKVQCWCFMYPTGLPVANSAMRLRKSLQDAIKTFDPHGTSPSMNDMIMVGHSMGGLLTRMQIQDAGEAYWHTWFRLPPEKVPLDGEVSKTMRDALLFKANPCIKETVFIATPHRGAKMADSWIGQLGSYLIRVPQQIVQIGTSVATLDVEMLSPERLAMANFGINSISTLSPKHPFFKALNTCPMNAPCHSIIGNLGSSKPLHETTDGVVPYTSSHLDEAKSETVVPHWHGCVEYDDCAQQVVRIVRDHLQHRK